MPKKPRVLVVPKMVQPVRKTGESKKTTRHRGLGRNRRKFVKRSSVGGKGLFLVNIQQALQKRPEKGKSKKSDVDRKRE